MWSVNQLVYIAFLHPISKTLRCDLYNLLKVELNPQKSNSVYNKNDRMLNEFPVMYIKQPGQFYEKSQPGANFTKGLSPVSLRFKVKTFEHFI